MVYLFKRRRLTEEEERERQEIKDMNFTWPEIFAMIWAFYKAIFPYVLIFSAIMIGLFFLSIWFLGGFQ